MNDVGLTLTRLAKNAPDNQKAQELSGPYVVSVTDDVWAIATDSRGMLWAKKGLENTIFDTLTVPPKAIKDKLTALFAPGERSSLLASGIAVGRIKEFCGPAAWNEECPACKGTSAPSEYVSCTFCEGDGVMAADDRYGYFYDIPLDRNRLAQLLEPFNTDSPYDAETLVDIHASVLATTKDHQKTIWLIHRAFRAILISMSPNLIEQEEAAKWAAATRFPQAPVEASK